MGTRNGTFWDSENRATDCDFALGLKMRHQSEDPPKKTTCEGDIYDVVSGSGGSPRTEAWSFKAPFTADQRQELQRQSAIFKYMVSSVPVPPELLVPISKTSSTSPSPRPNVGRGSIELGFSGSSDPEPWRCRRTDGKKWRCSRDVVPDQKYCERHTHKGRPRSRKPVELNYDFTDKNTTINNNRTRLRDCALENQREIDGLCSFPSSGFDQPKCSEWFTNAIANPSQEWHQNQRIIDPLNLNLLEQNFLLGSIEGLNQIQTQETIRFIDEIGNQRGSVSSSLTLAVTSGEENEVDEMGRERPNWMGPVSWTSSNSPPGGPLAEALCLGISSSEKVGPTSSPHSTTTSTS